MSNRRLYQFLFSKQPMLKKINALVTFGASGAVASVGGPGVLSCTKLTTGIYQLKLIDNYVSVVGYTWAMFGGAPGSNVTDGSFVTNTLYEITALGTTSWAAIGLDADFTPAVGQVFVATGAGGSGGGTAKAIGASNVIEVEIAQSQNGQLSNNFPNLGRGAAFIFQAYGLPASGQVPALVSPALNSQMHIDMWFRDSSVIPK